MTVSTLKCDCGQPLVTLPGEWERGEELPEGENAPQGWGSDTCGNRRCGRKWAIREREAA